MFTEENRQDRLEDNLESHQEERLHETKQPETKPRQTNWQDANHSLEGANGSSSDPASLARPDWMHDTLTRHRDAQGNSFSGTYAYDVPAVDDVPLDQSAWARLVALVEKSNPTLAYNLHAFYERKLRPSIHRVLDVRRQEEEAVARRNAAASAHNKQLEANIAKLRQDEEMAIQKDKAALTALEEPLSRAHREAAHRASLEGVFYDPQSPNPSCVLRHVPASLEALAAELRLPWTPDDEKARLPKALAHVLTVGVGLLMGVSIGIMGRFYTPDLMLKRWPLVLLFGIVGVVIAMAAGESLKLFYKSVSERYWLGLPAGSWVPLLAAALSFSLVLLVADSYVEQQGLMAIVRLEEAMRALSRHAGDHRTPSFLYFLAGIILSLPYIGMNAWHGYLLGRYQACLNRLIAERDRRYAAADDAARERMEVRRALEAISHVHDVLRAKEALEENIRTAQARFQSEIDGLAARRLDDKMELDDRARARIQDAVCNYHGAQREWDLLLEEAKKYWEPT
jgi:hypothetical protein